MYSYQPNYYKHDKHKIFLLCLSVTWQHKTDRKPSESQSEKRSTEKCFAPVALMQIGYQLWAQVENKLGVLQHTFTNCGDEMFYKSKALTAKMVS